MKKALLISVLIIALWWLVGTDKGREIFWPFMQAVL